jgi:hypothetical protein
MHSLYALDLTARKGTDFIWRRSRSPSGLGAAALDYGVTDPELPSDGFASPFGFWFAPAPSWKFAAPNFRVEFVALDDLERARRRRDEPQSPGSSPSRTVRAHLKDPLARARPGQSARPLVLEINSTVARISVDVDTWSRVGETVLFAIAQFWRFAAIDRALDDLSDWSRQDLDRSSSFPNLIARARSRELRALRRRLQAIILDLPDFEGPLANPRGHLASGRAVRLYRRLCLWLGLDRFRSEIDERIEVVESIFDSLAQSLDHFQSLAFQIALELFIVAVLLLDVGLYFVDAHWK